MSRNSLQLVTNEGARHAILDVCERLCFPEHASDETPVNCLSVWVVPFEPDR
jgi:hypothetical protein